MAGYTHERIVIEHEKVVFRRISSELETATGHYHTHSWPQGNSSNTQNGSQSNLACGADEAAAVDVEVDGMNRRESNVSHFVVTTTCGC